MVLAVNYLEFYPPVAPPRSDYDEIISAGQFSEIGDRNVRDAISRYYSMLNLPSSGISYARTMSQQWAVWDHPAIAREFDPEDRSTQTHTVIDIELALTDSRFVRSLQMGHSQQVLQMGIWEGTILVAEQMYEEIARYRSRNCVSAERESDRVQAD